MERPSSTVSRILNEALNWMHTPYPGTGDDPMSPEKGPTGSVDCSHLVHEALKVVDTQVKYRNTAEIADHYQARRILHPNSARGEELVLMNMRYMKPKVTEASYIAYNDTYGATKTINNFNFFISSNPLFIQTAVQLAGYLTGHSKASTLAMSGIELLFKLQHYLQTNPEDLRPTAMEFFKELSLEVMRNCIMSEPDVTYKFDYSSLPSLSWIKAYDRLEVGGTEPYGHVGMVDVNSGVLLESTSADLDADSENGVQAPQNWLKRMNTINKLSKATTISVNSNQLGIMRNGLPADFVWQVDILPKVEFIAIDPSKLYEDH